VSYAQVVLIVTIDEGKQDLALLQWMVEIGIPRSARNDNQNQQQIRTSGWMTPKG